MSADILHVGKLLDQFSSSWQSFFLFLHNASFPAPLKVFSSSGWDANLNMFWSLWAFVIFRQNNLNISICFGSFELLLFSDKIRNLFFKGCRMNTFFLSVQNLILQRSIFKFLFSWLLNIFQKEADDLWCEGINLRTGQQVVSHNKSAEKSVFFNSDFSL